MRHISRATDAKTMITRFFKGMSYFGRAFGFAFRRRALLPWVLMPALLTLVSTLGGAVFAWHWVGMAVHSHSGHGALLDRLLWLLAILAVGAGAYMIYVVACLVTTAPFAGLLSERTEQAVAKDAPAPSSGLAAALASSLRGAVHALVGIALYVAIAAPLFLAHWLVPPLAPLCWVACFVQTALFFAFDGFNEPLHRRGFGFRAKWRFIGSHLAESLGFGCVIALLTAVPLVSVLVAPLAIVGGTLLFADLQAPPPRS